MRFQLVAFAFLAGLAALVVGCSKSEPRADRADKSNAPKVQATVPADEHGHKEGAHAGVIIEIGRDNYHAEAVFEKDGVIRLYTLGKDEAAVQEVDVQTLEAYVKADGGMESLPLALEADPQKADPKGKTTRFTGTLPEQLRGKALTVTVPNISIAGQRFRFAFSMKPPMPGRVLGEKEKALYLTPGGRYTLADIKANGNTIPSLKFQGVISEHNMDPKPGDKICPITETKANPSFTWIVGGKPYEFCCPPCIDEFLKKAKEAPEAIKTPESYRKK